VHEFQVPCQDPTSHVRSEVTQLLLGSDNLCKGILQPASQTLVLDGLLDMLKTVNDIYLKDIFVHHTPSGCFLGYGKQR